MIVKTAKAHQVLTKGILPLVDDQVIGKVNKAIDSPSDTDIIVENVRQLLLGDIGQIQGLSYRGHRRRNHNAVTAFMKGLENGGADGISVALAHLGLDLVKDEMVRGLGTDLANAVEKYHVAAGRRAKARRVKTQ